MKIFCWLFFLVLNQSCRAQIIDSTTLDTIKALIQFLPAGTEVSIAISQNGKQEFKGIRKVKNDFEICDNSSSTFQIGSITKVFTCLGIAKLVKEGKLSLTGNIQTFYPFKIKFKHFKETHITIENLCNHTAGLRNVPSYNLIKRNPTNPYHDYSSEDLYKYLSEKRIFLISKPGTDYNYSNLGYAILGDIITKVSGEKYFDFIKRGVLIPFKMNNTFEANSQIKSSNKVQGLNSLGLPTQDWDFKIFAAAGALESNAKDMISFMEYNFTKSSTMTALTNMCQAETYRIGENFAMGLGWFIIKSENDTTYYKSGGTLGFSSNLLYSTKYQRAVVVLSNISDLEYKKAVVDKIGFYLLRKE